MRRLRAEAGGWRQITENGFAGTEDPAYRELPRLVETSFIPLANHDVAGICGLDLCQCGGWVRIAREVVLVALGSHLGEDSARAFLTDSKTMSVLERIRRTHPFSGMCQNTTDIGMPVRTAVRIAMPTLLRGVMCQVRPAAYGAKSRRIGRPENDSRPPRLDSFATTSSIREI